MAQVVVTVNERPYTMQCQDGEEDHVLELAGILDTEVAAIRDAVGQVGDIRLLLMAGLVVADRLSDALNRLDMIEDGAEDPGPGEEALIEVEAQASARLDAAAKRLEKLARDINNAA